MDKRFVAIGLGVNGGINPSMVSPLETSAEAAGKWAEKQLADKPSLLRVAIYEAVGVWERAAQPVVFTPLKQDFTAVAPPSNGAGDPFVDMATQTSVTAGSPSPTSEWKELTVFKGLTEDECNEAFPDDLRLLGLSVEETNALYKQGCIYFYQIAELSIAALHVLFADAGIVGPLGHLTRERARDKVMEQRTTA